MPYFFNTNQTGFCQTKEVMSKIGNLTASYASSNAGGQGIMTVASGLIIMFILIMLFLRGTFDVRAVLGPNFLLLLSSALALFLPVMSYLFSEAKDAAGGGCQRSMRGDDLSVRARVILTWMLLVELLRKKVDEIRVRGSYAGTIQRAGRVAWLGSLVYFNITSPGRKAVFSVLWILCATKLLQRIVFTVVEKHSYPDKSWLISSYMAQMLELDSMVGAQTASDVGDELLKRCHYIVMGEEKLVGDVTADGYRLKINDDDDYGIITVGKVWQLAESDGTFHLFDRNKSIRRVCLSFALFKLLRRRFEHLPVMTAEETRSCRNLMLNGHLNLYNGGGGGDDFDDGVETLFLVMADEVKFLSEYYYSVVPVVLASPLFLLVNYFLVPMAVLILCLIAIAVCGNGDVSYAFSRMSADNYALQPGFAKLTICALARAGHSRPAFFFTLDLVVTLLLIIIFFAEEIWEFLTFLISNWFIISMLWNYVTKPKWRATPLISAAFSRILWLRRKMSKYTNIRLKQFSLLLNHSGPPLIAAMVPGTLYLNVKSVPMTNNLKLLMGKCLAAHCKGSRLDLTFDLRNHLTDDSFLELLWAFGSESVTEIILTWHIATFMLEANLHAHRGGRMPMAEEDAASREVAMTLSQYCAYLVVFHPELLPDRRAKAELVLKLVKEKLRDILGFWDYYFALPRTRTKKLLDFGRWRLGPGDDDDRTRVVHNAVRLARKLNSLNPSEAWKVLSHVWTELLVYAAPAPASDEEHVKGHADILVEGVELITVLWAFATHTGMESKQYRRRSNQSPDPS